MQDDARYTPAAIRPLVTHENPTGAHLVVTFTCPVSQRHVNARWTAPAATGIGAAVASQAKTTVWYEVRRQVHSALYGALGSNAFGRIAARVVDSAIVGTAVSSAPSAPVAGPARDEAVIGAFRSVASEFVWVSGRWVHKSAAGSLMSPLDRQVHESPLTSTYDRTVGARIALEVSLAHGGISDAERTQLEETLDPAIGSLESLQNRPPLSKAELAEVSPGARVTLLALGWTIALCDEAFDTAEDQRLAAIASGLSIPPEEQIRARDLARAFVLDQWFERAFAWGGHDVHLREQAIAVGQRLGMTRDEVETAEARFQKRRAG